MKLSLIVVGPVPPPFHGVTVSTTLVLANERLSEHFDVRHFDTSDHRSRETVGRWESKNALLALKHAAQLVGALSGPKGIVYLPISGGLPGFLRDSLLIRIAHLRGWKVAGHFRNGDFHLFLQRQSRVARSWIRGTLRRITSAGVLGERIRDDYSSFMPSQQMVVVPNGTPDHEPAGNAMKPSPVPQILYLSNLRRRKGVIPAMEAAVTCLDKGLKARFVFAGDIEDDRLGEELRSLARGHADSIQIRDSVTGDAKRDLYLGSDVFLFPPIEPEGHPRVVLEAMAAGLPVISTSQGAIPETVQDGVGGYVVAEADAALLADRLERLIGDETKRNEMGNAARARYLSSYTERSADERLADWLAGLIA